MDDQKQPESGFSSEFQKLGGNIKQVAQAALESEEFKRFQDEMNQGLAQLGESLNKFFQEVSESPTGQRVKSEIDDFQKSARTGDLEAKVRQDVLTALRKANEELEKAANRWRAGDDTPQPPSQSEAGDTKPEG
jgi:hypothetical protein